MPVNAKCVPLPRKPHCQPFQASVPKQATSHFLCIMAAKMGACQTHHAHFYLLTPGSSGS